MFVIVFTLCLVRAILSPKRQYVILEDGQPPTPHFIDYCISKSAQIC